jgi:hypothetical protein
MPTEKYYEYIVETHEEIIGLDREARRIRECEEDRHEDYDW